MQRAAFDEVEQETGISAQLLERSVTTVTAHNKGVLDNFSLATAKVGNPEQCDAAGHMGKNFIVGYNNARVATAAVKGNKR